MTSDQTFTPREAAAEFAALVDELIPGDDDWPAASAVGVHGLLAARLFDEARDPIFGRIAAAVLASGGPLAGRSTDERLAIMQRFEATEPALFEHLRAATVLAYYESPFVAAAIRRMGRPYHMRPHEIGYPFAPFDPAKDTPRHGRGHWQTTDAVKPVDAASLKLDETRTARWGLDR